MTRVRAVLLDVDGTLVDSNDAHAWAWVEAFAIAGFEVPFAVVRPLIGKGGDHILPELVGLDPESPRGKALTERRSAIFQREHLAAIRPFPDARALLERLGAAGLELVVATSARDDELRGLLRAGGIADLVDATTSASDAPHSKPSPDIVEAALVKAGCSPAEALMLGDTPYDVAAARRAGVEIIALRSGGFPDASLVGALAIFDGTADLLAHLEHAPRLADVIGLGQARR